MCVYIGLAGKSGQLSVDLSRVMVVCCSPVDFRYRLMDGIVDGDRESMH